MGLARVLKEVQTNNMQLAFRPAQAYLVATGAYTVFVVRDGAIEVVTFGGRVSGAPVGATDVTSTFSGVGGDAGAVAINGVVNTVVYIPVNVGGAILNAAAMPKTVATLTSMIVGPGNIVLTFGTGTSWTGEWFMRYRKLSPLSRVTLS